MGGFEHGKDYSASKEDMKKNRIGIAWRDECAGLLIPLNKCRKENSYLPFRCGDERHAYEECQFVEYQKRVDALRLERKSA